MDTGSLRTDLKALGLAVAEILATTAGRGLLRAVIAAGEIPELAAFASEQIAVGINGPGAGIIARAIQRGECSKDLPAELVLSSLAGSVIHRIFLEQQGVTVQWVDRLVDMICLGIERTT